MAQKVFIDPIVYEVGKDITQETYQEAVEKIADWFSQSTSTKEAATKAKTALRECMEGKKKDGAPWFEMATATLAARVRSKCRFDIEQMKPLEKASEAQKAKKLREREKAAEKRRKASKIGDDKFFPDEIRNEAKRDKYTYGNDPNQVLTSREKIRWNEIKSFYLRQFPEELSSLAAQLELDSLVDLHLQNERQRARLLADQKVDPLERKSVIEQIDKLKSMLGIHPNQLAKNVKNKVSTTIGDAAKRIEKFEDWRKLRSRFFIEEMMQLYQMYQSLSADGLSYQLDEVGLFGMTKCRTCVCAKCGIRNFVGISIEEIETWLIQKGVMEEVDPASPDPALEGQDLEWEDDQDEEAQDATAEETS